MHIRCGEDIFEKLAAAGIPGDPVRWADPLSEGPLHRYPVPANRLKERAAYLATRFLTPMAATYRDLKDADWRIEQCERYDETVLWFEADLYDQFILIYLLARLRPLAVRTRLSLICIGSFPGVERFVGLGQLEPAQLASLLPTRRRITPRQYALAEETWTALTASDPRQLIRLARTRARALPFLPDAIRRYLAEYPSTVNGLGQTAQWALEAIGAGARTPRDAFPIVQQREARPFLGDSMFYAVLRELATGDHPAIAGAHPRLSRVSDGELAGCGVWLTEQGKKLLTGRADWCALSGATRQLGGVTLRGDRPRWRWNPKEARLMEQRRSVRS